MKGEMKTLFEHRITPERTLVMVGWVPAPPSPPEMTRCSRMHCNEEVPYVGIAPFCPKHGGTRV